MDKTFLPDDPRLMRQWEIDVSRSGKAVFVVLLLGRPNAANAYALTALTPAQAREVALALFQGAEDADREMNKALQQKEDQ